MSSKNRNTEHATVPYRNTELATVPAADSEQLMITRGAPSAVADLTREGFAIEKVVSLEPGDQIRGIFDGPGGPIEVTDPRTKEPRPLGTWRLRSPDGRMVALLLDCAQLGRTFGAMPIGTEVALQKLPRVQTRNGMMANDFLVATKPARVSL